MTTRLRTTFLAGGTLLLLAAMLTAQKVPLPDGSGRQLQLFDLRLLGDPPDLAAARMAAPGKPDPKAVPPMAPGPQAIADLLARLVEPALGAGDACQVLGERWLAVLGSPAQIASAERLFQLAVERRDRPIAVQIRLLQVGDKAFVDSVKPHLIEVVREERRSFESVLEAQGAKDLEAALGGLKEARSIDAPRLSVIPLQQGHVAVIDQTAYVRDFDLERKGGTVIANPIVDTVWSGNVTNVCVTCLPDDTIGLSCDVAFQEVQKPIQTYDTKVGGGIVTIQLPRVTGTRLRQTAVLAKGSLVVLATQKVDGDWIVALVRANAESR